MVDGTKTGPGSALGRFCCCSLGIWILLLALVSMPTGLLFYSHFVLFIDQHIQYVTDEMYVTCIDFMGFVRVASGWEHQLL